MQTHLFSLEISNPEDLALFKALAERLGYAPEVEEKEEVDEDYYLRNYELPENPFDMSGLHREPQPELTEEEKKAEEEKRKSDTAFLESLREPDGTIRTPIPEGKPFDHEAFDRVWNKYPLSKEEEDEDFDEFNQQVDDL